MYTFVFQINRTQNSHDLFYFKQVVEDAPYVTTLETLDAHNMDFCVHGGMLEALYKIGHSMTKPMIGKWHPV